ncbi:MAG TPA: phage head-tail connector protein [Reyranella sp.]|nr:phage head-tail connector protein [Reyranella sp.]
MTAPAILDDIKADLGITGNTDDAWLQRRINAVWARMEVYTSRKLCAPPAKFVDDWGQIASQGVVHVLPPILMQPARGSVFLRCFPVVSIEAVELHEGATAADDVTFDARTGKLFSVRGSIYAEDLSVALRAARAKITYTAGWATVPADLYEIVLGALQPLWAAKKAGGVPGVSGALTGISVQDVGSIELAEGNLFVSTAAKAGGGSGDPLLGPYANMLELYIDHRVRIGNAGQPTTVEVPPPPAAAASEPEPPPP